MNVAQRRIVTSFLIRFVLHEKIPISPLPIRITGATKIKHSRFKKERCSFGESSMIIKKERKCEPKAAYFVYKIDCINSKFSPTGLVREINQRDVEERHACIQKDFKIQTHEYM